MRPSAARRRRFHAYWLGVLLLAVGLGLRAQTIVGPDQMDYCDTATFTTTITNQSVTLSACLLEITRSYTESGVDYVPGSTVITLHDSTILNDDPTASAWDIDTLLGEPYTLPPTKSITIAYDLVSSCAAVSGTEQVIVNYEDCADPGVPLQNVSSVSIEILPGAIVVSKTPTLQDARVGDLVTWTITVENTGLGRVDNVTITDVLGPGLAYGSSTGGGSNAGQTTTWDISSIPLGESESVDLTAEVIACKGLYNDVDAAFGCGLSDICFDTAIDEGTATASLNLIVDNPALSFTPPNVTVGYCTDETAGLIQITNSGAGTARNVKLCCDFAYLEVDPARLPADTTYATGCFLIPDIPPNSTFDLTFYVLHPDVDWCGPGPSGSNTFQLTYTNDCSIPFVAYPQFSALSSEPGPTLSVSKTALNSPLHLGETGAYDIKVEYTGSVDCGGGSPGPVTIVDTYPEGFTVVDPAGGTDDGDARTITWAYDPADPPFDETIQLQAPSNCGYCAQPGGGSDANSLTATGTDCCGCPITSTASADTTILCEGYGGDVYFTSTVSLDQTTTTRCSEDYAVTVTHRYEFEPDSALNDFLLNEFLYFVDLGTVLEYATETATVSGATLGVPNITGPPDYRLELPLTDSTSVSGRVIEYTYTLVVQDLDASSCDASSYPIHAGIDLGAGVPPELNLCGTMYSDSTLQSVTAQPPAMNVTITGVPEVQEYCATYPVTVTLERTSDIAQPYDVRLVLTNNGGSIIDPSGATCGGTLSPITDCTDPSEDGNTYEWLFGDGFTSADDVATITIPITIPCSGPLANLSVVATFDDLCLDDDVYDDACSVSDSGTALLALSANVFTRKSPEILYATTRDVEWTLVVHNTGNAAAYSVWVDDELGNGLVFDSDNTDPAGATMTANEDHLGNPINGATFLFDQVDPGELITITFAATLDACDDLTNHVEVSWGCGGSDCQAEQTDDSIVVVPPANLIATTFSPTPVPMCAENSSTTIIKNAGVSTVYGIVNSVTLPNGLTYLTGPPEELYPEVRVNGGSWSRTGEPDVDGQTLTWTSTETPELASANPKDVIETRFNYTAFCGFTGGNLSFQAGYEDPCGDFHTSNTGTFSLGLEPASLSTTLRQTDPAPGQPLDCGGEAAWEIDVVNTGTVELAVIQVEAILGDGLTYVSSQGDPAYGPADGGTDRGGGQSIYWEFEDLPVGATATLQVTARADRPADCEALDIDVIATWGCGDDVGDSETFDADCTTASPDSATISATREPPLNLTATLSPGFIAACADTMELTLEITNNGTVATTSNIDFVITLPDELSYVPGSSEIDCGEGYAGAGNPNGAGQTLTWYDIAAEEGADDACASIPPGGTIRLQFDVNVSCFFTSQDIPITVTYYDCCGLTQYDASTSVTLDSLVPDLTVAKTAPDLDLDCYDVGDTVTWTITVENTGSGIADWVRLVDTLGSTLVIDSFTNLIDKTPSTVAVGSQAGQTITWEADASLAPGESLSATVTAHAVQPSDDCSRSLRRNTAVTTWGCGTLAVPTCEYGTAVQDQSTVRVPNLTIAPADITPVFACVGDGIAPGSGQLQITVRNQGNGDAQITENFAITVTEPNTDFSVTDTFVGLGGTLPLDDDTSQTLTLDGWNVSCGSCSYAVTVTLDSGDTICECTENDNAATLNGTITLPDLVFDSADLTVTCASDRLVRIQGPVTLRNDGCGDPLVGDLSIRFRLFDAADCAGNEIDTFTVDFTGLSIASGGGTQERTLDVTRMLNLCDTCVLSIQIEADEDDTVCECDGTSNDLCAGTFPIVFPDLTITDIDFSQVACASDNIAGNVRVIVENEGCGASGPFDLRLETDGCLTFTDETVDDLASGASTTVDFAIVGSWADCADCSCTFTATVDPDGNTCECDGTNSELVEPHTSTLPDLEISGAIGAIGCATDGQATVDADVTVENTGCGDVAESFGITVTVYDGADCAGNIIGNWTETISGETITAGGSNVISLTQRTLSESLCAGDCDYSAHFVVDSGDDICECDATNNEFCLSSIPSKIPDLVVTEVDPLVDCRAGTATVTATVGNVGCGDATGVIFRLTSSGCAPTTDSAPIDLAAGESQDVVFGYTPDCDDWNCTFTVAADPGAAICECDGANSLTLDPYPGIGSIGDRVWFDTDAEGDQDPGEIGIANVTVILEADLDGDGIVDYRAETTTDGDGEYLFDDLPAGDYTITVDETTLPDGMGQTYDDDGLGTPHTSDHTLAENEHNREQDFGYRGLGSIGDYVWFDANADGVQDPSESAIANVTVTLAGDLNGDGIDEILTTTTDADGLYLFDFLPAGPYTITVDDTTLPDGLTQTYDDDGLGSPHTSDYTLGAGEHNREQDFGYAMPALSVDKVITDILRRGASIGNITGPVEPGDVIVYEFAIENVGPVPAYNVGFDDTLPPGIVTETDAPGDAGSYEVSDPFAAGSLGLADGVATFDVPLGLTVNAGETLTATFTGIVTSSVSQGDDLMNTAHAYGEAEDGTPIPPQNSLLGDDSDTDVEDSDADDTGIVTVPVLQPALSVDKTITGIFRPGEGSLGISGPVEPGDTVSYRFVLRNVGGATAYDVEFTDTLPPGMVTVAGGTYSVSSPATTGTLALPDAAGAFTTSIDATIGGDETMTAEFDALVTSDIEQGVDLVNTAEATSFDGFGTEIPDENPSVGDEDDDDVEDPDADDTGIAVIGTEEPALSVDKIITDIVHRGSSVGDTGPVEPGDVVFYQYTIRNVGLGTAYAVNFTDTLPTGLVTEIDAPGIAGNWAVDDPPATGTLAIADGVGAFTTAIGATIAGGGRLVAEYTVYVTSDVRQGVDLINVSSAVGIDGAGNPIPGENADVGDLTDDDEEDADADDTGITIVAPIVPALSVDKRVIDVIRGGSSIGVVNPVLFGDVIVYEYTIRNVGLGTAYRVEFTDTLPTGLEIEAAAPGDAGTYEVDAPAASGSLALIDGVRTFSTAISATIDGGSMLTATYAALVSPDAPPAQDLVNTAEASGEDGAGTEIPDENTSVGDTSDEDSEDPDADDTGIASVRVGIPALVTDKSVIDIVRGGQSIGPEGPITTGDAIVYRLLVKNVGEGTAFNVDVRDALPEPFAYRTGSTVGTWPSQPGLHTQDPLGSPGPSLVWSTDATLGPDDSLTLIFEALVDGPISAGEIYTNVLEATGEDGARRPIPPNSSNDVPEDDDPDDRDTVALAGVPDAVPAAPLLRKTAQILGEEACAGFAASADRLWFQTDIALFAASEFELLGQDEGAADLLPETFLPTWLRTVRTEAAGYALDNLLQVDALSEIGLTLVEGPRILDMAAALSLTEEAALETRLAEIASRANLDPAARPLGEAWIYLEFAGGEPVYTTWDDNALGPYGEWTILDRRIIGSALGMGLLKQSIEADGLLASGRPLDRYVGLVLAEVMANKIIALDTTLTLRPAGAVPYVPHVYDASDKLGGFVLQDDSSHLFDQLSLLWGLARFAAFIQANPSAWSAGEAGLRAYLHARSTQLINEILTAIEVRHLADSGAFIDVADGDSAEATTANLGLLLVALEAASKVVGPFDVERIEALASSATAQLLSRVLGGRFIEPNADADSDRWLLSAQLAGIRGLLVSAGFAEDDGLVETAQATFDALDGNLWIDSTANGLYAASREDDAFTFCYTPLDVGLAVGALRELAAQSPDPRGAHILSRLAGFTRSVVDEAALQLSNAVPLGGTLTVGNGRGSIRGIEHNPENGPLAPVLQQRLCLETPSGGGPCTDRIAVLDDPWYQTDISMYAAFVLQDRRPEIEDYADTNLAAVVLHSTFGVTFRKIPMLTEIVEGSTDSADPDLNPSVDPIAIPFASGSQRLAIVDELRWDPATFDDRILASAVGMTLLRESQEVRQILASPKRPGSKLLARVYTTAILQKLRTLDVLRVAGPEGIEYVPHASRRTPDAATGWSIIDRRSTLFDQLSLLYGLSEAYAVLTDERATPVIDGLPFAITDWGSQIESLVESVLATLETGHWLAGEQVLVDEIAPGVDQWERRSVVTTSTLGLTAAALEHASRAFARVQKIKERADSLLAAEVGFLQRELRAETGEYCETWTGSPTGCVPQTLLGQLGALRGLLTGQIAGLVSARTVVEAFAVFDARFWDSSYLLYSSVLEASAWCATPLELGLTIDTIDRMTEILDVKEARVAGARLTQHVDRVLDALWMQLSSSNAISFPADEPDRFAPVFDREVCLLPSAAPGEDDATAESGDLIAYTITAVNPTDQTFANLLLEDRLPNNVTLVSTDSAGEVVGSIVRWTFEWFEPSEELVWNLLVRVDENVTVGELDENCATLAYADLEGVEQIPLDACVGTRPLSPD